MDARDFMPPEEVVAAVRTEIDRHNEERSAVLSDIARWKPVYVGTALAAAVAVAWITYILFSRSDGLVTAMMLTVAFGLLAVYQAHEIATQPLKVRQQRLRDSLFPKIFGFVEDLRYQHRGKPLSFTRLPAAATGRHTGHSFDDVIAGRYAGFPFELYETTLTRRSGKSTRTVFRGLVLAFQAPHVFPGTLVATKQSGEVARFFRDLFGDGGLKRVETGDASLDAVYEVRSDNPSAARPLIDGNLARALDWLRETWPGEPARVALCDGDAFILLPMSKNFFELPVGATALVYETHVEPIVAELAALIATASLVRKAVESH